MPWNKMVRKVEETDGRREREREKGKRTKGDPKRKWNELLFMHVIWDTYADVAFFNKRFT